MEAAEKNYWKLANILKVFEKENRNTLTMDDDICLLCSNCNVKHSTAKVKQRTKNVKIEVTLFMCLVNNFVCILVRL